MLTVSLNDLHLWDWIGPGDHVLWGQSCAEPVPLTRLLVGQRQAIARGGRFSVLLGAGAAGTLQPEHADCIDITAYCGTGTNRNLAQAGVLDALPCHYSQMAAMLADGRLPVDVLLLHVAPGVEPGTYSLSMAQEYVASALARARVVIALCNDQAPSTHGQAVLTAERIDVLVALSHPPIELAPSEAHAVETAIARHVASLVDDGDTLQFGLGAVPDAVLSQLGGRRDLGIHSGLLCDRAVDLIEQGAVTNARKTRDAGLTVAGVLMGSRRLFDHVHLNPRVHLRDTRYTHDADVLASLDRLVAINSAVQVDLGGQANTEVVRGVYLGAVGGALDFLRGAARSRGGKPIIALPSTAGAHSRITPALDGPASVPRSDVAYVVTEHGIADLRGATLAQRRQRLIDIAHPDHRAALDRA